MFSLQSVSTTDHVLSFSSVSDIVGFELDKDNISYCLKVTAGNKLVFIRVSIITKNRLHCRNNANN